MIKKQQKLIKIITKCTLNQTKNKSIRYIVIETGQFLTN